MATTLISRQHTVTPFVFSSLDRAGNAAKRLKSVLELRGCEQRPLGWYKKALARTVGYGGGWDELRRAVGAGGAQPGRLDHEMRDFEAMFDRRMDQADRLAKDAGIDWSLALRVINEAEPTGNGTGPFRLEDYEDDVWLRYRPPPLPASPDGKLLPRTVEAADGASPCGCLGVLEDRLRGLVGVHLASALTIENLGYHADNDAWRIGISHRKSQGSVTFTRYMSGHVYEDEPRPLRPTEIDYARQEWEVIDCKLPRGGARDDFLEVLGTAMASHMIQDMVWALTPPRPPVIRGFGNQINIFEDEEDQVMLASTVVELHAFTMATDSDLAEMEEGDGWLGHRTPSPRIRGLCREIEPLEMIDQ